MEIVAGIDMDPDAAATFEANFPEAEFICRDVRAILTWELRKHIASERVKPLLFSACAPCQPFSKQNRDKMASDQRSTLLDELHRFVRCYRPEYIFIENVPGAQRLNPKGGPIGRFLELLRELEYEVAYDVVDFLDYGVPQTRRRLVMTASLLGRFKLPPPTHGERHGKLPHSTIWEWIGDLPPLEAGASCGTVPNHQAAGLSAKNLLRIANTPEGGDRRDWPEHLILPCHKGHDGHTDVYGRLRRDRPASTLTTRCVSLSNGRFGHPLQDRALSLREAACLQTFPREFVFKGAFASMAMQIGNAVPVLLARRFGETIRSHFHSFMAEASN
jgi:DNA (cytosine-5)-methyltransferase 1